MVAYTFHVAVTWWRVANLVEAKVSACADADVANIIYCQRITIVAGGASRLWHRRALTCLKVTGAWKVAHSHPSIKSTGLACTEVHTRASSSGALVLNGLRIAIVAARVIGHLRIGANTSVHITHTCAMAGVQCCACYS
jgi:hypothetical protein